MKTLPVAAILALFLLSACAAEWQKRTAPQGQPRYVLQTRRVGTIPSEGLKTITERDLRAGDILFSSERSLVSVNVRLFNRSAVSHTLIYPGSGEIAEAVGAGAQRNQPDRRFQTA
ncbi:C40 family peptidase [Neisseria chenwenguii]|uniref:Uncharacterized protein n=1 Tax=Neisseria chenwenguii TaxID=1853278 RepID=A0A220S359_9NEIS|nr:hypothetical protein [Neisseria chenwenguii]ASK27635.1 hypothetical protein BG910_07655 [Neisseria chenwenguii]ROV54435.1 hypothetical protein EGS38_11190 [Neisseria chenwenguii]